MVLAFLGVQARAMGIPAVACITVASNGFLALGARPWPHPIPMDDATRDLGSGAGTFSSRTLGGTCASASPVRQGHRHRSSVEEDELSRLLHAR